MSITENNANELIQSIYSCDVEKLVKLVDEGADLEKTGPDNGGPFLLDNGATPLLIAIQALGQSKEKNEKLKLIIKKLLDANANVNHMNNYGQTALHLLLRERSYIDEDTCKSVCMELINRRINLNLCLNKKTHTALMQAISFWNFDLALLLIQHGANVNYFGSDFSNKYETRNALMVLVEQTCNISKEIKKQLEVLDSLLQANADLNLLDDKGQNILFYVLNITDRKIANELLTVLLKKNVNVLQTDKNDNTPISTALQFGKITAVLMMLDKIDLSNASDVEYLVDLLAEFGCVQGLQKLYDLAAGGLPSNILIDTFGKIGTLGGSLVRSLFGHGRAHFIEEHGYYSLTQTIKWFLKYMDSDALLGNITMRRVFFSRDLVPRDFNNSQRRMFELQVEIQRLVTNLIVEELSIRFEVDFYSKADKQIDFCSKPEMQVDFCSKPDLQKDKKLLFLHPSRDLAKMAEITEKLSSQRLFPMKREFCLFMQSKEMRKKRSGLLPYWVIARRGKEFSSFKFCDLSQPLKAKIMSYLEPKPLAVAMAINFAQLLNNRLNLIEETVDERENQRRKQKEKQRI